MQFSFQYRGGVYKPSEHVLEKFMLFLLVGEQEVPFFQAIREGVAARLKADEDEFGTKHSVMKLFVSKKGFGLRDQYHSFWIKLDPNQPMLKIVPYSGEPSKYYFRAASRLMKREEVLEILDVKSPSYLFFSRQEVLPVNLRDTMVSIDKSTLKTGVRYVKVGRRN